MPSFTREDLVLLDKLVPIAQRLVALDKRTLGLWLWQISDQERALLVTWAIHHGSEWITASLDTALAGQARMHLNETRE